MKNNWTTTIILAIPVLLSIFSGILLLTSIALPNNAFRRIIYILASFDIILAVAAIPITLPLGVVFNENLYLISRIFFDASFFLSFCLSLIAFTIAKLEGSVESIPYFLIVGSCLLTGLLHAITFEAIEQSDTTSWFWLNFADATLYTIGFLLLISLYILTYKQLLRNKRERRDECVQSGWSKSSNSRYHASELMTHLIMSLTITNVVMWLPIVITNWIFLDSSAIPTGGLYILYIISISTKGFFHALCLIVVLGLRPNQKGFGKLKSKSQSNTPPPSPRSPQSATAFPSLAYTPKGIATEVSTILESLKY